MAEIVLTTSDGSVSHFNLGKQAVIGRHPECEIVLTDPMSSRRHCRVEQMPNGGYFVQDLGSANGTMFRGEPLRTREPFCHNDVIQIGLTRLQLFENAEIPHFQQEIGTATSTEAFDPNLSIVQLKEDVAESAPNIDYVVDVGKNALTEEDETTSDLGLLKRVTQRLKLMLDLGEAMGQTLDPKKVLQTCIDKLFEVFPQAGRGFVLLYGPDGELPSEVVDARTNVSDEDALAGRKGPLSVSKIRNPGQGEENTVQISSTVVKQVRTKRQAVLLSDTGQDDGDFSPGLSMARLEIRSVMCAPLVSGDDDLGILYLDTKDSRNHFGPDDVNLLTAVAGQVAVVIKNAELAREAAAEASTREHLQRYLSPHLAEQIMRGELGFELGGTKKYGTVFFSDIVGFTRMASQMKPADVVTLLNKYFRVMQEIIFSRGGTVDKFNGDQIMAFWGVLVDVVHAEAAATCAAIEMQNAMFALNRELASGEANVKPPEPLGQGIGLNTGDFVAGNIGSDRKIEFTVIGNAVNLAQRVESIAGRGQVFIGHGTFEALRSRALAFQMPDCPVKNVAEPLKVYSIRGIIPVNLTIEDGSSSETSRLSNTLDEMTFTLPCFLCVDGKPDQEAIVTRLTITKPEGHARMQVLTDIAIPVGADLTLKWDLQEKPSLSDVPVVVDRSWMEDTKARADETRTGQLADPDGNTVVAKRDEISEPTVSRAPTMRGTLVLIAPKVNEELFQFVPGELIVSDLTSPDQIIRV